MKYFLFTLLLLAGMAGKGQNKGDTTNFSFSLGKPTMYKNVHGKLVKDLTDIELWTPQGWTNYLVDAEIDKWHMTEARAYPLAYNIDSLFRRLDNLANTHGFDQIVFLLQQNKELSDRLDRVERRIDTLVHDLEDDNRVQSLIDRYIWEHIDSFEKRPYMFYDPKGVRPGFYLTNSAGEYQIFVSPLK